MGFAPPDESPKRALAIDLGDARTGLALADLETKSATPLNVLEIPIDRNKGEDLLAALAKAIDDNIDPRDIIVLGLPLNMDGTEGPRAKLTRTFADKLEQRVTNPIKLHDERLTSADAEGKLNQSGLTHAQKKARRDALAAAALLRDYLETLS